MKQKREFQVGDTWEYIDPETGNHGVVYLDRKELNHPSRARKYFTIWYWWVYYYDGDRPDQGFDWHSSKSGAVMSAAQKLVGMGSNKYKIRFKYNPKLYKGELK